MRPIWVGLAALVLAGCTHAPEFVREYPESDHVAPALAHPVRIAVAGEKGTDPRIERHVADAFRYSSPVSSVVLGRLSPPHAAVDYTVDLHVERRAASRGTNFVICWPGFIIFTPAWHGLEWPYRVNTRAVVERADGSVVGEVQRSDLYMAYFTSDTYGICAGLGWIPPFYSLPALVTGIVASFAPEERRLDNAFVSLEGDAWAQGLTQDLLALIAHDQEEPGR
jgi:hypothetical protein